MSSPQTGRRETAKAERRDAILDAALTLIDHADVDGVHASVEAIAREANVAPATVYNLFGTRDAILVGLVRRLVVDIATGGQNGRSYRRHPLASLLVPIDLVCAALGERPRAWSHIILRLGDLAGTAPTNVSSGVDLSALFATRWRDAQTAGFIQTAFSPDALGLQTYTMINGALMRWAVGRISHDALRLLLRHGTLLIATAAANESHAKPLAKELRTTGAQLASALDNHRSREPGSR
jgi:AcrR family transcriptional regulator